jgi:hypothetical protein
MDPDLDPGIFMIKMKENLFCSKQITFFQSLIAFYTLIEDFQAQVKTIRASANWSMLFLKVH